jgi:V/A-type H+-transporting ATPase subunit I
MVTKMKKYTFLIFHKDYHPFLYALRELGVMHVVEKQCGAVEENSDLHHLINTGKRFGEAIKALNKIKEEQKITDLCPRDKRGDGMVLLEKIEKLYDDRNNALSDKNTINRDLERINPWGYIDMEQLQKL